jgi:repressor LexA
MTLTPAQLAMLRFIAAFRADHGLSPKLDEIAAHFGITKITVHGHLVKLERKGAISRQKGRARSIEILDDTKQLLGRRGIVRVRGSFRERQPIEAKEREIDFAKVLFPAAGPLSALRVDDGALAADHVVEGDYLLISEGVAPRLGDAVVAVLADGKATLKRLAGEPGRIRLNSLNGSGRSHEPARMEVRGVAIALVRLLTRPGALAGGDAP